MVMSMTLKEILNKYPVTNGKWVHYESGDSDILFTTTLYEYIQHIVKKDADSGYLFHWMFDKDEYERVTEFFLRFNYNDYRENSDAWGRQFKAYKPEFHVDVYKSRAIVDGTKIVPKMYVTTTSVEGVMVYFVEVMTEV